MVLPPPKYDEDEAPTDAFPHEEQINTDPKFNDQCHLGLEPVWCLVQVK